MTYFGVLASAVLHVGGLFLLLTARAPEPLVPLGSDTPLDVSIISLNEYNAITSQAPQSSTLAALREQPVTPQPPMPFDLDPLVDTQDDSTPEPQPPAPVEMAMRLPPPEPDPLPEIEDEAPLPDSSEVAVAPAPLAPEVDAEALQDREVDPRDLIPNDDVSVAVAPPAPRPPRGGFDAPLIDTSPDEPPEPSETEGEGETVAEEPAPPSPDPVPEPVQTAEIDDPAPLATPFPVPKPRGSLAVASEPDPVPAPARVAEALDPAQPVEPPTPTQSQLSEAEMEQERRMMAAIMEQMRANQPPSEEELRAAEAEALRKLAEEQRRQEEIAALDEAERRAAEEAFRREQAEAARQAALQAEAEARARAEAEREARALAELRARQEEALRAQQEAARQAALDEQRRIREAELARQQAERDRERRRQQLAELNANVAPETTASNVLTGAAPPPAPPANDSFLGGDSALASILGAADTFANRASTGPSFSQGGGARQGASLTPGETQAVLNQLRRCWRVDTFSANARSQVVTLQAQLRQNGFVNQTTIQVISPLPTPPEYRIAVERAVSALQDRRCQPFALPPAKYNAWRDIVIRFDPAQMVLQ